MSCHVVLLFGKDAEALLGYCKTSLLWLFSLNALQLEIFFVLLAWLWKFASAFSISRNVERIFNTAQKPEDIHCLHGLRFISISWVILGHSLILMVNFSGIILYCF